jgi:hypothetical protein
VATFDDELEKEARALLRERIERTPWFRRGMTAKQRRAAIEREVNAHWRLVAFEAARRLIERQKAETEPGLRRA